MLFLENSPPASRFLKLTYKTTSTVYYRVLDGLAMIVVIRAAAAAAAAPPHGSGKLYISADGDDRMTRRKMCRGFTSVCISSHYNN